ncbi:hypothetical protein BBH51_09520 [Aggregatibacter actinomycetemcomitans]|uniref:Transmembrane protein n=5 Tax=Aggregatibacter actinomycetemcomitans TaxID=714 RepID=A0AB74N5W8_AGGAC|nr:hypothetical protein [Aggregatibacter actinomycetemcomitans]ANU82869.1 hypothetical protein BBH51_09520 [Aggregatibacter actinomycetemcomitans]OZV17107.1 hypothetical protein RO04_08365 [Aggregatibacter actinomycetemcomitans]PHO20865.1 hypothetical protein CQR80_05110 [Aggregatibacter actinomycetemcomitans]PHO23012.1 hypothetical protein CQR79_05630 [Aggregatibacter actinomycetemcomitans]TYA34646.1 hypothetical protein FXB68_07500 [Aggregatibacter actinomycetemcomitans]
MQKQDYKELGYSIRKCNYDEIEIRLSVVDGYIRGFIRATLVGILCVGSYFDTSHGIRPFRHEINNVLRSYYWATDPDVLAYPQYLRYKSMAEESYKFRLEEKDPYASPPLPYEEYKESILPSNPVLKLFLHIFWIPFVIFLIFLPRMPGIRVNRQKRLIYWQSIGKNFEIAYVPEKGEPLAGLVYDKFGLYSFGGGKRFSLRFDILTQGEKEPAHHYAGVYPTPNEQHNDHILLAIQAYLTEENPAFLQYIGKRFKVFGDYPLITFCNFAALPCCFARQKAQIALDNALAKWHKKTENQKQGWFNTMHGYQKHVNKQLAEQELDNQIKKDV